MNKNVDVLAVILVLVGFACVSLVERWRIECPRTTLAETTVRQMQSVGVDLPLPRLCLTRQ